ncbi:hypothetical protein VDQ48_18910, partial [Xanthomonas campestris pv. campestris]|nr:hypothetical protein [Xanthomonas campestris pv. campestris]
AAKGGQAGSEGCSSFTTVRDIGVEPVRTAYNSTSGDVHFSEKQFFASVTSLEDDEGGRSIGMMLSQFDTHYPEFSWSEMAACFSELCEILIPILKQYGDHKAANGHGAPSIQQGSL